MKTSLVLFAAATLAPTLIVVGLGTTAAFGIASVIGVSAMMIQDYGPKLSYQRATVQTTTKRTERHPLAA